VAKPSLRRKLTHKLYRTMHLQLMTPLRTRSSATVLASGRRFHLGNVARTRPINDDGPTMSASGNSRRWERLPVDMPVRVVTSKGFSTTVVEGRGTEMSQGGMVLYAGILLNPGDLLEIEFDTPMPSRIPAIVRSKNGFCFGLEFITPLPA
jgi:PilZ domain